MAESVLTSRDRIQALVATEPGLHLREFPRRLGLSLRSVRYHLEAMAEDRLVTVHRSGRYERFFPAGSFSREDRALISALRAHHQRRILAAVSRSGPLGFARLQEATALSPSTLARHLGTLLDQGLLSLDGERRYGLRDPGATTMRLALFRERFPDLLADAAVEIFDPQR